ncbi:hypothetical protein OAN24_01670 [Pseudodesulfovibrio sp.]|nr:hypothetical protein [Pseudodesulfovibrio sp.]
MRIASHASDEYRKNSALVEREQKTKRTEPQASVKTTSFGFDLGKFGLRYESQKTVLDPSLSRGVREKRQKQQAFRVEAEVENLRATVGERGADYRDQSVAPDTNRKPAFHQVKSAMAAYARSTEDILPPPGNMLASVV